MSQELPISKWWTTPSAKSAWARADKIKKEKLAKLREDTAAKKAKQQKELDEWEERV